MSASVIEQQNATLVELARSQALESGDFERALRELTEAIARTTGVRRASLWLYTEDRKGIRCLDLFETDKQAHAAGVVLYQKDFPNYFKALEEDRIIPAHDAHTDPRTCEFSEVYLKPLNINSMLDSPIRHRGRMVGVVCQEQVGPARTWTEAEQSFAGSVADFVALALEANERHKAERQLADRVAELARSNAELEQFAYVASHDLQEPLRMVSNYVSLLERKYKDQLDDQGKKYIRYAVEGASRMHSLINDVLYFSRAGKHTEEALESVDTAEVMGEVLANMRGALEESGAEVKVGALPTLKAYRHEIAQLLQNLVSNAVKYRNGAAPRVEVQARQDGGSWVFSVKDNGIGIDPAHHDRIFRIFQRLHERGKFSGNGVGLAIVKRILDGRQGKIWVESAPGQGSTFFFSLPAAPTGATDAKPEVRA